MFQLPLLLNAFRFGMIRKMHAERCKKAAKFLSDRQGGRSPGLARPPRQAKFDNEMYEVTE